MQWNTIYSSKKTLNTDTEDSKNNTRYLITQKNKVTAYYIDDSISLKHLVNINIEKIYGHQQEQKASAVSGNCFLLVLMPRT